MVAGISEQTQCNSVGGCGGLAVTNHLELRPQLQASLYAVNVKLCLLQVLESSQHILLKASAEATEAQVAAQPSMETEAGNRFDKVPWTKKKGSPSSKSLMDNQSRCSGLRSAAAQRGGPGESLPVRAFGKTSLSGLLTRSCHGTVLLGGWRVAEGPAAA
jgi:hypothetical protein